MRRLFGVVASIALTVGWLAAVQPAAAFVTGKVTFTASPNPSVTRTTFRIVIKLSGPTTNLKVHLEAFGFGDPEGSVCLPVANCTIGGLANTPSWSYATASGTVTATLETRVPINNIIRFFPDGGMAVTNPPVLRMKVPTVTSKITYAPAGVVDPGDTIHITVKGTANAGPLYGTYLILREGLHADHHGRRGRLDATPNPSSHAEAHDDPQADVRADLIDGADGESGRFDRNLRWQPRSDDNSIAAGRFVSGREPHPAGYLCIPEHDAGIRPSRRKCDQRVCLGRGRGPTRRRSGARDAVGSSAARRMSSAENDRGRPDWAGLAASRLPGWCPDGRYGR